MVGCWGVACDGGGRQVGDGREGVVAGEGGSDGEVELGRRGQLGRAVEVAGLMSGRVQRARIRARRVHGCSASPSRHPKLLLPGGPPRTPSERARGPRQPRPCLRPPRPSHYQFAAPPRQKTPPRCRPANAPHLRPSPSLTHTHAPPKQPQQRPAHTHQAQARRAPPTRPFPRPREPARTLPLGAFPCLPSARARPSTAFLQHLCCTRPPNDMSPPVPDPSSSSA